MSSLCQIQADPDISGIGIRIEIYITSYLIAGVPNPECSHYGVDSLRGVLLANGWAEWVCIARHDCMHINT